MGDKTESAGKQDQRHRSPKGSPTRILIADEMPARRRLMATLIADKLAPAMTIEAGDVPAALDALLTRHPDFVFADLTLPGHTQGGFRLILDAASLGVPAVVTSGPIARTLELRLAELKIGWVPKGASNTALFAVIDWALESRRRQRNDHGPRTVEAARARLHTA